MTQSTLLRRAKRGDAAAIAALINRHAKHQGVVAQASLQQRCLYVILEGHEPPPQAFWSRYLTRALSQLSLTTISQLRIYGRSYGAKRSAWSETISLSEDTVVFTSPVSATAVTEPYNAVAYHRKRDQPAKALASTPRVNTWAAAGATASLQRQPRPIVSDRSSKRHAVRRSPEMQTREIRTPEIPQVLQQIFDINMALALRWFLLVLLVGIIAAAIAIWLLSSATLGGILSQVPPLALPFIAAAALGYPLGRVQESLLKNWIVSSDRWEPVTVTGAIAACLAVLVLGKGDLALPVVAIFQWTALRNWVDHAYGWIVAHVGIAIAAALVVPLLTPIATAWANSLIASDLPSSAINSALVGRLAAGWLIYSAGSAIAVGKLFYRP